MKSFSSAHNTFAVKVSLKMLRKQSYTECPQTKAFSSEKIENVFCSNLMMSVFPTIKHVFLMSKGTSPADAVRGNQKPEVIHFLSFDIVNLNLILYLTIGVLSNLINRFCFIWC